MRVDYYSINQAALKELNELFGVFFNPARIKPRARPAGPGAVSYA